MTTIAFLGLGLINKNLAVAAVERAQKLGREERVVVWNRSPGRVKDAVAECPSLGHAESAVDAVAGASRVHIALADDDAVDGLLTDALVAAIKAAGAVVVDHTTTAPLPTQARAERLRAAGVAYLHAPVFMSPANCRAGTGIMLLVGEDDVVAAHTPALAEMTGTLKQLGTDWRKAATMKLIGNAGILSMLGIVADTFQIAAGVDMSPDEALEVFSFFNPAAGAFQVRGPKMAKGDFTPSFELTMARKDVRLMMETAGARPLAVLPSLAARMDTLLGEGEGQQDVGVLAKR